MKLIKWIVIWMALAVLTLMGLAEAVNRDFAEHWANVVLAGYLVMGLLFGISGWYRASAEKRKIRTAMEYMATSSDRQQAWATDLKARAAQARTRCEENTHLIRENPLLQTEYLAEDVLLELMDDLAFATEIHSGIRAAVQTMEEEDGAV